MKRIMERILWYLLGAATVWQIYASLERCGWKSGGPSTSTLWPLTCICAVSWSMAHNGP